MLAVCSGYVWLFFMSVLEQFGTNLKFWGRKMSPCEFFWLSSQCGYSLRLHSVWLTWTAALRQYGDETIAEKQWETQATRDMINPYTTQHHTVRQSRGNVFEWIDEVVFILIKRVDYRNVGKKKVRNKPIHILQYTMTRCLSFQVQEWLALLFEWTPTAFRMQIFLARLLPRDWRDRQKSLSGAKILPNDDGKAWRSGLYCEYILACGF